MSKIVGDDRSEAALAKQRYERAERDLTTARAELAQRIKENELLQQQLLDAGKNKDSLLQASKKVCLVGCFHAGIQVLNRQQNSKLR